MEYSDKCKGMENMNLLRNGLDGHAVLEEEEDAFGADSHSWSQEV